MQNLFIIPKFNCFHKAEEQIVKFVHRMSVLCDIVELKAQEIASCLI